MTANGFGSREKARLALKRSQPTPKHDDNPVTLTTEVENFDEEIVDAKPLAISNGAMQISGSKRSISRLESCSCFQSLIHIIVQSNLLNLKVNASAVLLVAFMHVKSSVNISICLIKGVLHIFGKAEAIEFKVKCVYIILLVFKIIIWEKRGYVTY